MLPRNLLIATRMDILPKALLMFAIDPERCEAEFITI